MSPMSRAATCPAHRPDRRSKSAKMTCSKVSFSLLVLLVMGDLCCAEITQARSSAIVVGTQGTGEVGKLTR